MSKIDYHLENFMLYCDSKNLSRKTLASYEQTLKLFQVYLEKELKITDINKVKPVHIRQYVKYLRERGKYTVVSSEKSRKINHPDHRHDFNKPISDSTVANYLRNIKVFFNFLESEREIKINPVANIENIKPKRKQKALLDVEEIRRVLSTFDLTVFHSYRSWVQTSLYLIRGFVQVNHVIYVLTILILKINQFLLKTPKITNKDMSILDIRCQMS